jgi:hypothetical protein
MLLLVYAVVVGIVTTVDALISSNSGFEDLFDR